MKRHLIAAGALLALGTATGAFAEQGTAGGNPQDITAAQSAAQQRQNDRNSLMGECSGFSGTALTRCQADLRNNSLNSSSASAGSSSSFNGQSQAVTPGAGGSAIGGANLNGGVSAGSTTGIGGGTGSSGMGAGAGAAVGAGAGGH